MRLRTKRRLVEDIPLASTADIAFLLIVFFLAASALLEMRGVQIPLPLKDAPPMQILKENLYRIEIAADGSYVHEGESLELQALAESVRAARDANPELVIVVRADPASPVEQMPPLIQALQRLEITRVSIGMER